MNDFIDFLTSEEMIIVGVIAAAACFLALVIYIIEKSFYKRKRRQNTKELKNLVEDVKVANEKLPEVVDNKLDSVSTIEKEQSIEVEMPKENQIEEFNEEELLDDTSDKIINIEEVEEKPQVIPIEELEVKETIKSDISDIYSEVKECVETLDDDNKEELKYTSVEPDQEEAREQLRKVTEDLINKENESKELENIELTKFEEEQEENAIISLDELMKKSTELYEKNEATQYIDEGNEPISLQDLELRMNNIKSEINNLDIEEKISEITDPIENINKEEKVILDDFNTIKSPEKLYRDDVVFKSSPIISPIFGIEQKISSNDIELENTANYEKLDEEIKKTNEFIVTLKELQKKLD